MDRREALKRMTAVMGGVFSLSTAAGVLGGCRVGPASDAFVPQALSKEQDALVTAIAELIIPTTDTPGATAARVNEYVDKMLSDWYPEDNRIQFAAGLADVDERSRDTFGKPFVDGTAEEQHALLTQLESERTTWRDGSQNEPGADPPFFQMMREMTIAGHYTSEIGATQELKYEIVFDRFDGAVPYAEVGRAWS